MGKNCGLRSGKKILYFLTGVIEDPIGEDPLGRIRPFQ
jgi:hypothetical protein